MVYDTSRSLLAELNEEQRQAVTHVSGPLLVLAGAGTGKTKVLTSRIAFLLSQGVQPESILALTFTRKAGDEMQERVTEMVGAAAKQMRISTFHSLGLSILREQHQSAGLPNRFRVSNRKVQTELAHEVLSQLCCGPMLTADQLLAAVSAAKNGCPIESEDFSPAVEAYVRVSHDRGLIDFDDMLGLALRVLESSDEISTAYREQYRYVLVDEFQDTNEMQFRLLRRLLGTEQNLFVVGDDDQSIYGFRGAARTLILNFGIEFPSAKMVMLTRNYRCSAEVVRLANTVIAKSATRYPKTLRAGLGRHGPVELRIATDSQAELGFVAKKVSMLRTQGIALNEIGVLVRVNSQLKEFRAELKRQDIPVGVAKCGVRVMTLHAAKGLQFSVVFLPGLEEHLLPHWNAINSGRDAIEEERRLFYVGVTRARRQLILSWCQRRGGHPRQPSPFLNGLRLRRLVKYKRLSSLE